MSAAVAGPIFAAHREKRSGAHCWAKRPVLLRHVFGHGGMASGEVGAHVAGDALAAVEELDGALGVSGVELACDEGVGDGVVVAFDVMVDVHAHLLPLGEDVSVGWQRAQRRAVDGFER